MGGGRQVETPCYSWVSVEVQVLHQAFTRKGQLKSIFPMAFDCSYCLKVFYLTRLPLSCLFVFSKKSRLLFGAYFVCSHWNFWVDGFFSSRCKIYEAKIKLLCCSFGPETISLFLSTLQTFLFVSYTIFRFFQLYFMGRIENSSLIQFLNAKCIYILNEAIHI